MRTTTEQFFLEHCLTHTFAHGLNILTTASANTFADFIAHNTRGTTMNSIDYTIRYGTLVELDNPLDVHCILDHHNDIFYMLMLAFSPSVLVILTHVVRDFPPVSDASLREGLDAPFYDMHMAVVPSQVELSCKCTSTLVILLIS